MTTLDQTRAIQAIKRQIAGFTDEDYRALIERLFHKRSSVHLGFDQAAILIVELRKLAGPSGGFRRPGVTATGPHAKTLQALWIAAFNLGIVAFRDDRAMLAFVERQTGISHTKFLIDPVDARKAIEGLKAWIAREAELEWPKAHDTMARKRAIVAAQTKIVRKTLPTFDPEQFGTLKGFGSKLATYDARALDLLSRAIGKLLRGDGAAKPKRKAA